MTGFFRMNFRKVTRTALCGALIALTAGIAPAVSWAQAGSAAPPTTSGPVSTVTAEPSYVISPEDQLDISVLGQPEYTRQVGVNTDGFIDYPLPGSNKQIKAAGKKIQQLKDEITKGLKKRYVNPQVSLTVRQRRLLQVNVFGAFAAKGKIGYREGWRVRDVIAAAGGIQTTPGTGVAPDRYEFMEATLLKASTGETKPIDLKKLFLGTDAERDAENVPVDPEDTLNIREKDVKDVEVKVLGQVIQQTSMPAPRSGSIVEVLSRTGGPTEKALLSGAVIRRFDSQTGQETVIPVDLRDYKKEGFDPKVKIQPGDILYIPENKKEYYMFGNFRQPGPQLYPEDKSVSLTDAIARAGGNTDGLELKKTMVVRRGGAVPPPGFERVKDDKGVPLSDASGAPVYRRLVNVEKMMKTGDRSQDFTIQPGDEVYVQQSGPRRGISFQEILGTISAVVGIYYTFKLLKGR